MEYAVFFERNTISAAAVSILEMAPGDVEFIACVLYAIKQIF